jgi:hypothetical protein
MNYSEFIQKSQKIKKINQKYFYFDKVGKFITVKNIEKEMVKKIKNTSKKVNFNGELNR